MFVSCVIIGDWMLIREIEHGKRSTRDLFPDILVNDNGDKLLPGLKGVNRIRTDVRQLGEKRRGGLITSNNVCFLLQEH